MPARPSCIEFASESKQAVLLPASSTWSAEESDQNYVSNLADLGVPSPFVCLRLCPMSAEGTGSGRTVDPRWDSSNLATTFAIGEPESRTGGRRDRPAPLHEIECQPTDLPKRVTHEDKANQPGGRCPMSSEMRRLLARKTTEELVEALRTRDPNEWRPEVFPLIESILQERGVDVAAAMAQALDRQDAPAPAGQDDQDEAADDGQDARDARDSPDFVKLMDLPDVALLAIAKSLMEEGGFRFYVTNDNTQHFIGLGQVGTGFNVITGPPGLMVESTRLEEARELLEPLLTAPIPDLEDEEP